MLGNPSEARELVRQVIKERVMERAGIETIVYFGEEINVVKSEDGSLRYNLLRLRKSFALL